MRNYLSLIKFSHTIFALPFALIGFFLATIETTQTVDWRLLILVLLCMVFARSAAMAFNRFIDRDIDEKNPRTSNREIPAGIIKPDNAIAFVVLNCILFCLTTWFINPICFFLSPVALLIILGYSYTKRFTFLCHFVLGLGLALAPIGAFLAVVGQFELIPLMYSAAVFLWVAGFDIIYALQDIDFDQSLNLHSVPVAIGKNNALLFSSVLHVFCALFIGMACFLLLNSTDSFGWLLILGSSVFVALLFYQHLIVKPDDLSRINLAFFTTNGIASLILGLFFIVDLYF